MSWDDQSFAARFRDLIVQVSENVVDRVRPDVRLGKVYSFDVFTLTGQVLFAGETVDNLQPVKFSADQLPRVSMNLTWDTLGYDSPGDIVRVAGKDKLYCVGFVSGTSRHMEYEGGVVPVGGIISFPATVVPNNDPAFRTQWVACSGQTVNGTTNPEYARLFSVIGNTFGGSDITDFVIPRYSGPQIYKPVAGAAYTTSSGWGTYNVNIARMGNVVTLQGTVVRTGSGLAAGTDGNITNTDIFTLTDPALWPPVATGVDSGGTGVMNQFLITAAGTLQVVATPPNNGVATGDTISFDGTYGIVSPTDSIVMMKL